MQESQDICPFVTAFFIWHNVLHVHSYWHMCQNFLPFVFHCVSCHNLSTHLSVDRILTPLDGICRHSCFVLWWPCHAVSKCSVPSGKFWSLEVQWENLLAPLEPCDCCALRMTWSQSTLPCLFAVWVGSPYRIDCPSCLVSHHTLNHLAFPLLLNQHLWKYRPAWLASKCANPAKEPKLPDPGSVTQTQFCVVFFLTWPGALLEGAPVIVLLQEGPRTPASAVSLGRGCNLDGGEGGSCRSSDCSELVVISPDYTWVSPEELLELLRPSCILDQFSQHL